MANKIVPNSKLITHVIEMSFSVAVSLEQTTVTTEHVLLGLLQSSELRRYFSAKGVVVNDMFKDVLEYLEENSHLLKNQMPIEEEGYFTGQLTSELTRFLTNLESYAATEKREVDLVDVLLGLLNLRDTYSSYFMGKYGINEDMILELRKGLSMGSRSAAARGANSSAPSRGALQEYCENLNEKMKTTPSDPMIGRTKEVFTIAHTLCKRKKCNAILVGDPGVGKSMIVEGLAQRINDGNVPTPLKDKIIFSLDVGSLVAGSKYRGDYEEKITGILDELSERTDAILFIDEAQQMDAGDGKGQMGLGLSSMIKPYLSRGVIKLIASTTWEGFRQTFEKDQALMRRFRVVTIGEPSNSETLEILKGSRDSVQIFHNVTIEDSALEAAVELTVKYQPEKRLPDKAIDVLDSACARKRVVDDELPIIDRASIIREITDMTGIVVKSETNNSSDSKQILELASRLKNVVFHQDKAVDTVSQRLVISQAGLKKAKKPIGSFLFVGPSGVGKTLLAQKLADELGMTFNRYDMSEFQEKHAAARLIGAPPGYIGFGDGGTGEGQLVNDLLRNKNGVFLFDEVEKAHPDTFNIFLNLLEEGQVTGTTGKVASAKNCIIIMTSNLGTKEGAKSSLGFVKEKTGKSASAKAVDDFFLTELRGRMTAIVEFSELDELSYRRIVSENFAEIGKLLSSRNLRIVPSETLISHILQLNKDSQYGARKIASLVDDLISFPIATKLLEGKIANDSVVNLDWANDELVIDPSTIKIPLENTIEK